MTDRVVEVLGVYDADGGLRGEAAYVVGKLLGRTHCSLCDITHRSVRPKQAWDELVRASPTPVRVAHRNELSAAEADAVRDRPLPLVIGRSADGAWRVLIEADRLDAMGGSVETFGRELNAVLAS